MTDPTDVRTLAVLGLRDPDWRVRRTCARVLDDLELTAESSAELQRCLDDERPEVRRAALHTLSCEHCKPDGCNLDVRGVLERMATDPNARVRSTVVGSLWFIDEPWSYALLQRFVTDDRSAQVRALAVTVIASHDRKHQADDDRQELPPELRAKVDRHTGKWVAVAEGNVVAADRFHGSVRRAARGKGHLDARLYWVGGR